MLFSSYLYGMKENLKVRNATVNEYDGIRFRSLLERRLYVFMKSVGIDVEYEPESIELIPQFRPRQPWYLDGEPKVTKKGMCNIVEGKEYTPDFRIMHNGRTIYIEAKGQPNDVYPVTRKLFLNWIERQDRDIVFAEIHSLKGLKKLLGTVGLL